jgi:hypothetical protein
MAIMLGARYIGVMNIRGRVNCAAPPGRCEAGRRVRPVAGKRLRFLSAWVTRAERRSSRSGRRRAQRDTVRKLRVGAEGTSERRSAPGRSFDPRAAARAAEPMPLSPGCLAVYALTTARRRRAAADAEVPLQARRVAAARGGGPNPLILRCCIIIWHCIGLCKCPE